MKVFGNLLLILGIIFGFSAITMDTSVSTGFGRINNLGLMNDQSNLLILAGIGFIAGILLIASSNSHNGNSQQDTSIFSGYNENNSQVLNTDTKKCPYCAETIKKEAVICRYCNNNQPTAGSANYRKPTEFIDNNDGTVIDKISGLVWQKCVVGQKWNGTICEGNAEKFTWHEAVKIKSDFMSKTDWRLPTKDELMQLAHCSDVFNYFPNTEKNWFWSSSSHIRDNSNAWLVSFSSSCGVSGVKDGNGYVLLVRNAK